MVVRVGDNVIIGHQDSIGLGYKNLVGLKCIVVFIQGHDVTVIYKGHHYYVSLRDSIVSEPLNEEERLVHPVKEGEMVSVGRSFQDTQSYYSELYGYKKLYGYIGEVRTVHRELIVVSFKGTGDKLIHKSDCIPLTSTPSNDWARRLLVSEEQDR